MSMMPGSVGVAAPTAKTLVFNLSQVAGTYDLATANGDVWVEVVGTHVKTAAAGLTSAQLVTNHTTPKLITASTILASLTLDGIIVITAAFFLLPSAKKIQGTIVGTGSGGEWDAYVRWSPATPGATLI